MEHNHTLAAKAFVATMANYEIVTYAVPKDSPPIITGGSGGDEPASSQPMRLTKKLKQVFLDMEIQSK